MTNPKPCPFCGSVNVDVYPFYIENESGFSVFCDRCATIGPEVAEEPEDNWDWNEDIPDEAKEKAIVAWNRRV